MMKKVLVVFHSQQYGNTKIMAEAVAEGIGEAGATAVLINTNERRVGLDDYLGADAVALGTPDYYSYPAGTIKTLFDDFYLWDKRREVDQRKTRRPFSSAMGAGGRVRQPFESFCRPLCSSNR